MTAASSADRLSQQPVVCTLCAALYQWCPVLYIPSQPGCATLSLTAVHKIMEKGNSFWESPLVSLQSVSAAVRVQHFSHWALCHGSSRKSLLLHIIQITAFSQLMLYAQLQCTVLCCKRGVGKCTSTMCPAGICWLLFAAESCDLLQQSTTN